MSSLNTFFSWRGAHHGKRTGQAVRQQSALMLGTERARWRASYPGQPYPPELRTVSEQNAALLAGTARPWTPAVWWTVLVLAVLVGCTVIGLPVSLVMAIPLWAFSPYRGRAARPALEPDPPTMPIVTVPDPVGEYRLPRAQHSPRDLAAAGRGRHAR